MAIPLTEEQRLAIEAQQKWPVEMVNPATQHVYVLITAEAYGRVRSLVEPSVGPDGLALAVTVPPGILRSQQAFRRDLPGLLADKSNHGKWVCYYGDERLGIAVTEIELIRECRRRGLGDDEYDLDVIERHALAPWEPEEIEAGGHEVTDDAFRDPSGSAGEYR